MSKRGISPLIATVMLVGFAVALGAMVSTFLIKEAKDFKPESFLEDSPFCEGVVLEPVVVDRPTGATGIAANADWPMAGMPPSGGGLFAPIDYSGRGWSGCVGGNICLIHGIGFRNKGSFSVHSILVSGGGVSNQPVLPIKNCPANPPLGSPQCTVGVASLPPGKVWGFAAGQNEFRNPSLPYRSLDPSRVLKITPRVVDPEKTAEAKEADSNAPNVIVPCPKQEISVNIDTVCPRVCR
ncbi:MAG: archaellin/type IV pilin N-terminal domain-containing protein [Candidatus Nanoarchaeia archaeon]